MNRAIGLGSWRLATLAAFVLVVAISNTPASAQVQPG